MNPSAQLRPALDAIAQAVDTRLDRLLPVPDDPRARLVEAMRYASMAGGKRMRPLLCVAAGDLFEVDKERSLRVAVAAECVHVYSLVHDDLPCMDDDDQRRGKPTTHIEFDEATAVLAGDALQALAYEVLAHPATHDLAEVRAELCLQLAKASGTDGMAGGQMMDLAAEDGGFDLPMTTRLQQLKTGALIGFSVEAGAIMGSAGASERTQLRGYAHDLGLAFQIADDLLDIEGDEDKAGKALGKDEAAGKATFVSLMGVERARSQAQMLIDQAIDHLHGFGSEADLLRAVARFAISRDR
ncbi:farnesyl-diphosphate synthase [Pacificimonas flava]|uniref:Farnesyl-diphosphate synthase n=2 Tax=Pacificimonas TaxID=1960290 RepID=A0A219B3Y0_9SPHN|nr:MULTISPECIES: farnesyl diphosphate synthase [Pacificimonas]MBZ6377186.1 polyprenyl synthetase family protein [Pacificimonas aurantium]OWV33092.1 farnesyl-diphosphate synthase [Pacificimonas flava]